MYLSILSRVLLSSHEVFTRVLRALAQIHNETEQIVLGKIMDIWLSKMAVVSQLDQRKLLGLALTNLLTAQSQPVLERFNRVMVNILESLNDITKSDDNGELGDSLLLAEGRSPSYFDQDSDGYYETDHDQRKKQLILSDPVHTIVLKEYLQSQVSVVIFFFFFVKVLIQFNHYFDKMFELRNQIGLQQYQLLLQSIDTDTISQLKGYITF